MLPRIVAKDERYSGIRRIRELIASKDYAAVPEQIRKMSRRLPNLRGLQARREAEARLFETAPAGVNG